MHIEFINPGSLFPTTATETGAPNMAGRMLVPAENVTPTFVLPEQGSRPEDRSPKNKNPWELDKDEVEEDPLPEVFKLISGPSFKELIRLFTIDPLYDIVPVQRRIRTALGVEEGKPFTFTYSRRPATFNQREVNHDQVLLYHYMRPGSRFLGAI